MQEVDQVSHDQQPIERVIVSLDGVEAVIFDMDGVMMDSMPQHLLAWKIYIKNKFGLELTDEEFRTRFSGLRNDQVFPLLVGKKLTSEDIKSLSEEKEALYRDSYSPQPLNGLTGVIDQLRSRGIKLAIATSAPKVSRDWAINRLGLDGKFDIVLGEEDAPAKPDPAIYRMAANALGIVPGKCIVFEDSPPGVTAGASAGMRVVGVLTSHRAEELPRATQFIRDFTQVEFA